MIITKTDIDKIIPQRTPFVMIDGLVAHTKTTANTQLVIEAENILVEKGKLSASGLIENMAQTAAAHLGYTAYLNGLSAPVGFIAAIKNLKINGMAEVGAKIQTKIEYSNTILNIHIVHAVVSCENNELANAELRIFIE